MEDRKVKDWLEDGSAEDESSPMKNASMNTDLCLHYRNLSAPCNKMLPQFIKFFFLY